MTAFKGREMHMKAITKFTGIVALWAFTSVSGAAAATHDPADPW